MLSARSLSNLAISFINNQSQSATYNVASVLEIVVLAIILLLFGDVSVLKIVKSVQESFKGLVSLELEPNGVEQGSAEGSGINLLDLVYDFLLGGEGNGDKDQGKDSSLHYF